MSATRAGGSESRRQPLAPQEVDELDAVVVVLALAGVRAVAGVRYALPGAEGLHHGVQRAHQAHGEAGDGCQVVQAVVVHHHLGVPGGEAVATG